MALSWILHSACHVLAGTPKDNNMQRNQIIDHHPASDQEHRVHVQGNIYPSAFQMPLHYPRYKKADYQKMEEWKVDLLLEQYGLKFKGNLDEKRAYAMGAFLWPDQY
ncbi:hypothetical protein CIPAW_09G107200 [Carya illinoinensis]|uniref:DUF7722 domain-containing protein n=1 Tax=Carya illinoinensis TaxID=32201 RepID=A0A8T1PG60_CARIL|nr:hypothetical protein CIPAW_09G107200 [Carya illinoinensis]